MFRLESDSIGIRQVPIDAYFGVQSLRAHENFKISKENAHFELIKSAVEIKKAAARINFKAGVLTEEVSTAIVSACNDILNGKFLDNFIVGSIQGGAGTSFNMNVNEVIANRAIELLGKNKGDYTVVHPNDHVNCGQSTNDVYPTAGKIACIRLLDKAITELKSLSNSFAKKAKENIDVIKMGRTEMQDAVPISFGQVFSAFKSAIDRDIIRFEKAKIALSEINMGGTAIGTTLTADKYYVKNIVVEISKITEIELKQAQDLIDSTQNLDAFVFVSGIIKTCATTLNKIANDLRLMSSGPRTGFSEISLPPKQNGSSIMPGKINPVIPEVINQIAFRIIGNDCTITHAVEAGQLELNAFEPIIFHCLFESLEFLTNGLKTLRAECVDGLTVNKNVCDKQIENSISIITAIIPYVGYKKASDLAKKALSQNKTVKQILIEENIFTLDNINKILDPIKMI